MPRARRGGRRMIKKKKIKLKKVIKYSKLSHKDYKILLIIGYIIMLFLFLAIFKGPTLINTFIIYISSILTILYLGIIFKLMTRETTYEEIK